MTAVPDRLIGPDELERLAVGARVLAAGTEESAYQVALDWAAAELAAHGPVPCSPPTGSNPRACASL